MAHAILLEAGNSFAEFVVAGVLKAADQSDIARAGANHEGVADRRQRYGVADDPKVSRHFFSGSLNFQLHFFTAFAADVLRNFFARPFARVFTVHFDDTIAIAQSRPRCRRSLDHGLNVHAVIVSQNLHADAVKTGGLIFL